ncbi:hypothetical protein [Paenibacillus paridis]|uniref:hypothetical protein n=1 Tax=Paenibacillus paridis TaxID=2583376 RepID=UPI00111D38F9|nr:hypothetical protein [Paenibacillus paridis]
MNRLAKKMTATLLLFLLMLLLLQPQLLSAQAASITQKPNKAGLKKEQSQIIMTVSTSPNAAFISEIALASREINDALREAKQVQASTSGYYYDVDIVLQESEGAKHFRLEHTGNLWNAANGTRTVLSKKAANRLVHLADGLRAQHYGKLVSWQESGQLLPNKSIFSVTELDSGLTFEVQRRAGSDHADVQPLTKEDTRIMKQIYEGKWSWKRKAVLIHSNDTWIAASMNGMPHGGDGIPENGFSGHFCIHFQGSSTHKSDSPDPAHQIMVHKAAGQVNDYLDSAAPMTLAKTFIEILYHQDTELLRLLGEELPQDKLAALESFMGSLVSIREQVPQKGKDKEPEMELGSALVTEINLPVSIHQLNEPRRNGYYRFSFKRASTASPWRIQDISTS